VRRLKPRDLRKYEYEKNKAKLQFLVGGLDEVYIEEITLTAGTADRPPSAISLNLMDRATVRGYTFNDLPIPSEFEQSANITDDDAVD
jgi:hypothetical protein